MDSEPALKRSRLVKVFLCAALFRLLFLAWGLTPWWCEPQSGMSRYYFRQGYGIAAGYGLVSWDGPGGKQIKDVYEAVETGKLVAKPGVAPEMDPAGVQYDQLHPPGLALLVAGLHRLTGHPSDLPVQIIGLVEDSLAAVLLAWLVTQILGTRVGNATGMIYAFFPPMAYESAVSRSPEGMMALFIIGAMACLWQALSGGPNRWLTWSIGGGLVLGIGCYLRPDYFVLPIALILASWGFGFKIGKVVRSALVMQVVCVLCLFPWAWRNHALTGRWIFTGTAVGPTLITGLAEYANPWGFKPADTDRQTQSLAHGIENWTSPEADTYFRQLFWQSIKESPRGYMMSVLKRIPLAVAPPLDSGFDNPLRQNSFVQVRQTQGLDRYAAIKAAPGRFFLAYADLLVIAGILLLALLAWVYLFWQEPARRSGLFFLFCPHLYAVSVHLLTHLEPRFLLPSIGFLLISLGYLWARFRLRSGPLAAQGD